MISALILPLILALSASLALTRRVDVFQSMIGGATDGLLTLKRLVPSLIVLLTAVSMLRASGALEWLTALCAPLFRRVGLPAELAPLVLLRPISGSAALAVGSDLILTHGADSLIGRTAAVMMGSPETTFYTIAVYFGAAEVRRTRYAIPAALCADLTGFLMSALTVRLFWG